jgi:hypothetical protein
MTRGGHLTITLPRAPSRTRALCVRVSCGCSRHGKSFGASCSSDWG